ncbi:MAG: hypothetical protein PHQ40_05625 [Anaerolineaceae bacterium]|nr:hypothetical protein [Anaerolineaceae bacterium]
MGLDFVRNNGGKRLEGGSPLPDPIGEPPNANEEDEKIELDIERALDDWTAIRIDQTPDWTPARWPLSPVRFIDGKDVGEVIAWLRSPAQRSPIPLRLSQIGGIAMWLDGQTIRRDDWIRETVLSMPVDPFPWKEIESFGAAIQEKGVRLLPATAKNPDALTNFEKLSSVTSSRSREEMIVLEEAMIAQAPDLPTIVDGRLEQHSSGFDRDTSPMYGVIKWHYRNYLHADGQSLLYDLKAGERTPAFTIRPAKRLAVLTWYLKICDDPGMSPTSGYVRVEVTLDWFKKQGLGWDFADQLSRAIFEYRCRQKSYSRAAVSLEPIVFAEESLSSVFEPESLIDQRFFRLLGI